MINSYGIHPFSPTFSDASSCKFPKSESFERTSVNSTKCRKSYTLQYGISLFNKKLKDRYVKLLSDLQTFHNAQCRKSKNFHLKFANYSYKWTCDRYETAAKKNLDFVYSDVSDKENMFISLVEKKHAFEFETSYIRSNPHLITDIQSKYSAYCRLCKTGSYQNVNGLGQTFTITPTFSNLEFPEPQTKSFKSINKCHCCHEDVTSMEKNPIGNSLVNDDTAPFIAQTLPPDIFPVPSTRFSVQTTDIPYIYSYEVTINEAMYYSQAWTRKEISRGSFPVSSTEPNTLFSDIDNYGIHNSPHLESSIRSFPEVQVKSTEMPSIMLTHFSHSME